jgi:energy-coupling factor transporter transmembrane protein EcfT
MIQILIFFILTVLSVVAHAGILFLSAYWAITRNLKQFIRLKKTATFLFLVMILNLGLIAFSQLTASTPRIVDENGNTPKNSIAELRELELNGRKQWISLRGWNQKAPILLFLAGGPGGTQMAAVRHELAELEKHFVVVNWDQPGSGKSYNAEKIKNITVETYIEDGNALTEYLKECFSQEKIYLIGESWGSALGIFLIDKYPESYHAFIGTGQMVDFAETERMDYAKAKRCLQCKDPKCVAGCPVGVDIPSFIQLIMDGKFADAARKIKEKNALPAICGRVCPQESQCEKDCIMGKKNEPVAIGRLERFVADWELNNIDLELEKAPFTGKQVAVVGSGPSGLTCAAELAKMGHAVTVLEALHVAGGVLVYGIPEFRLPKSIVAREIQNIEKLGVSFKVNSVVGKLQSIEELLKGGFDAVYIATGAGYL